MYNNLKEGFMFDLFNYFGINANKVRETANRRFVSDVQLVSMGGIPKMSDDQMRAWTPIEVTMVYNTTNGAFYFWNGYEWKNMNETLAFSSEQIQNLIDNAVLKKDGYGLSKNDFDDNMKKYLLECYSWRHQRNKDTKISEGSKNETSAAELRYHLDNHPKGLTDLQVELVDSIPNKVDKEVDKFLMSQEQAQELMDVVTALSAHINNHPITVIDNGAEVVALTPEQLLLLNEIPKKVNQKAGYDLVSSAQLNDLITKVHDKNKDDYLAFGTDNEVSAAELRDMLDNVIFSGLTEEDQILLASIKDKCDKPEAGWGFSQNNYTNEEKTLLSKLGDDVENILNNPQALTAEQVAAIAKIANKVDKVDGRQLTIEVFTTEMKTWVEYYMANGVGGGGTSTGLTPEQTKVLSQLMLRSDELNAGYHLSEKNFTSAMEAKLKGLTSTNLTADQVAAVETIKDKVDKVEGKALSTNDFTDELKLSLEEVSGTKHDKDKDDFLAFGTASQVSAVELRKMLDNGGGAGIKIWANNIEVKNGSAVLDENSMIIYEGVSLVDPYSFKTNASIYEDINAGRLKPILTISKPREWAAGRKFETGEMIKGPDGKLYFFELSGFAGTTFQADLDSAKVVVVGGGHDKDKDEYLDKDGINQVSAKEIREHIDKAAIVPGIPDWKASTKYQNNQPLLDPITKIIYRVLAPTTPYYITSGLIMKADIDAGKLELISENALEELKAHILSVSTGGNSYVNTTTKIGIDSVPYTIKITNNINDDNKNLVQVWKVQEGGTTDITTIVKDFNNADKSNFEGDIDAVVFDGSMYQKDVLELVPDSTTALGGGFVSEFPAIDTTLMDTIVGFKVVKE